MRREAELLRGALLTGVLMERIDDFVSINTDAPPTFLGHSYGMAALAFTDTVH